MLIVLAIMALAAALVVPRGEAMLDQMTAHAVYFDFQRQLSDARREAYASERATAIRAANDAAPQDATARVLPLRSGWTYHLDHPIAITAGGRCSRAAIEVLKNGDPVMHLAASDDACHLVRLD
jgi:Tfp pilus assembly protein FimT